MVEDDREESAASTGPSDDMLDDYLQDRLPAEQRAEFEAFMMTRPDLLEQAELGLVMREGLKAMESSGATAATAATEAPSASAGLHQWRLAAVASLVAIGVGFFIGNSLDRQSGLLDSQVVGFPITRSDAPQALQMTIRQDVDLVMLRIPLPDPESVTYEVTIADDSGSIVDPVAAQPDGGGVLNVAIESASLAAGDYTVEIAHPDRARDALRIDFSVTP